MTMFLNKEASKVLDKLLNQAKDNDGSVRVDNCNGAFMPVSVEVVGYNEHLGHEISVAHYGVQNGDLMADPEMTFYSQRLGQYCPASFINHYAEKYDVVFEFDNDSKPTRYRPKLLKNLVEFGNTWMENIMFQQNLNIDEE